ncbi:hypothetical protein L226DRAFT_617685 [Lentinus tigrinus ALCF2SS1-7]|uniref:Uncharacterized protein n=1 Tax=Lentinus tigrinus ALCF2SS1-6 TaxID=1328759 RepID=A0A5C2RMT6_9APHY|nr:hypothetical protein L227DRAFT_425992 [Lentinus tigrinus ALCF2SS1-6]RPD68212.1 hypothetical protein L226DRAFT_617685 [Lentinus tigrinus ALCF2SS1-7]
MGPRCPVEVIESIAASMVDNARALDPWWHFLGRTLMDVTLLTLALGFLTFLTAVLSYLVISRRLRDSYLTLGIWVIPEWVTAATTWITAISRAAQEYAVLGSYIPTVCTGTDALSSCLVGSNCIRGAVEPQHKPIYTGHGCVGTALLTGNVLIQEGVLCALVLFFILPEHNLRKMIRGVVVAPFLAACVSAVLNVQKVCFPGDIITETGFRIKREWEIFDPHGIDPTTAKLTNLSHMVTLAVLALWVWKYRNAFVAQLNGSTENGYSWIRPLLIVCAVPPAVITGLNYLSQTYNRGVDGPIWAYFLFATAYSSLPPLMGMWPGVAMICWRLTMPENILPVTQGKEDIHLTPSPPSDVKVDLSSSGGDGYQVPENPSGL